jgi:Ricin-type beta-trefoil lectin domain-like
MRLKAFLIAALIIGAMAFPFGRNVMPVVTNSALPATLTAAGAAAQTTANPPTSYDVRLEGYYGYNLLARGFTKSPAYMYTKTPYCDEAWRFVPTGISGTYQIQNRNSGLCLVVQGTANGNTAFQYTCNKNWADQRWRVQGRDLGLGVVVYEIISANSVKYLRSGASLNSRAFQTSEYSFWIVYRWDGRACTDRP